MAGFSYLDDTYYDKSTHTHGTTRRYKGSKREEGGEEGEVVREREREKKKERDREREKKREEGEGEGEGEEEVEVEVEGRGERREREREREREVLPLLFSSLYGP